MMRNTMTPPRLQLSWVDVHSHIPLLLHTMHCPTTQAPCLIVQHSEAYWKRIVLVWLTLF